MKLPRHDISLSIEHNVHLNYYKTAAQVFEEWDVLDCAPDFEPEDRAEMLRTGDIWEVRWYPDTTVGFCHVAAATLERALELANEP